LQAEKLQIKSFTGGAAYLNFHTAVRRDSCHPEAQPKNPAYVRYIYFDSQMFRFAQHDRVERRFLRRCESEKCKDNLFCGINIISVRQLWLLWNNPV
jgi:hypothetical protein